MPYLAISHVVVVALVVSLSVVAEDPSARWPAWRGNHGNGIVAEVNPPLHWSETENIRWKTNLPGVGQSTPIIWGDKLFLQAAEVVADATEAEAFPLYRYIVLCLDRNTGDILWHKTLREARPHEGHHKMTTVAPFSPVTDGEHLWVSFGSRGLFCLNLAGDVIWEAQTILMEKNGPFGEGSSPVLVDDTIVVLADHEGPSKLFAFDKDTGAKRWEVDRDTESSWGTPAIARVAGRTEIITTAPGWMHGYNAADGTLVWSATGLTSCAAPSPVVHDGVVYGSTGYKGYAVQAIALGHTGDLTGTDAVRWFVDRTGSEVPSPLIYDNRIYIFRTISSDLSCYNATTGEALYERTRVPGMKKVFASPVAAGGHIYLCSREGVTVIIKAADEFEVVATNTLDEVLDASPVMVDDVLYLRGHSRIYSIGGQH